MAPAWMLSIMLMLLCDMDAQDISLNTPIVLLPYKTANSLPVNYTLSVHSEQGCFQWRSTRPELVTIQPVNGVCSSSADVSAVSTVQRKDIASIIVEDQVTHRFLKTDIFVDGISRIEISTTTKELLVGEAPEQFDIVAFDSEGNTFSSLQGLAFDWSLAVPSQSSLSSRTVLSFVRFDKSAYLASQNILRLEQQGMQGCSILVEGVSTGENQVIARLVDPAYKDVPPAVVKIMVLDNIMLLPSEDLYILQGTKVNYSMIRLRQNKMEEVKLPSKQYHLKTEDHQVASVAEQEDAVVGLSIGTTRVMLVDGYTPSLNAVRHPSAYIHVTEPDKIRFSISPGDNWALEVGRNYTISVIVFDRSDHKLTWNEEQLSIETFLPEEFFIVRSQFAGCVFNVTAKKKGSVVLEAFLRQIPGKNEPPVVGSQPVDIFEPILVDPHFRLFPWFSSEGASFQLRYTLTGGSGLFTWTTSNTTVTTVSSSGQAVIRPVVGSYQVIVTDKRNSLHTAQATVAVLPPETLTLSPKMVEAVLGSQLVLPVVLKAQTELGLQIIVDCHRLQFVVKWSVKGVFTMVDIGKQENTSRDGCATLFLSASSVGHTTIIVTLQAGSFKIEASTVLAVYPPLKPQDSQTAVAALGAGQFVTFFGGPEPWVLDPTAFTEQVSQDSPRTVSVQMKQKAHQAGEHVIYIQCESLGETVLSILVGNRPSPTNLNPALEKASIRISCVVPASLTIRPLLLFTEVNGIPSMSLEQCMDNVSNTVPVLEKSEFGLTVSVFDKEGAILKNISSLDLQFKSSNQVHLRQSSEVDVAGLSKDALSSGLFGVQTGPNSPKVRLTAEIRGFLNRAYSLPGPSPISTYLDFSIKSTAHFIPKDLSLFTSNDAKVTMEIVGGTGHPYITTSLPGIVSVHPKTDRSIQVVPELEGSVTLILKDKCLPGSSLSTANIRVLGINSIAVNVIDKVLVGGTLNLSVHLLDAGGGVVHVPDPSVASLVPLFPAELVNISFIYKTSDGALVYRLQGLSVGFAAVVFTSSTPSGRLVQSNPKELQVFLPLRLTPKSAIMTEGTCFQLSVSGGPKHPTSIRLSTDADHIANVTQAGLLCAHRLGSTVVLGQAHGMEYGKPYVYTEDSTQLEVVKNNGFKIHLSNRYLVSGTSVSVYAVGQGNISPLFFGSAWPRIQFEWSSSSRKVAAVESLFAEQGAEVWHEMDFHMVLKLLSPGPCLLQLTTYSKKEIISVDTVDIKVVEKLAVEFPTTLIFLIPPNSSVKIRTNRDSSARMSYRLLQTDQSSPRVVSVRNDGVVTSSSHPGTSVVEISAAEEGDLVQTVHVHVQVQPVAQVLLVPSDRSSVVLENFPSLPLGSETVFAVVLQSTMGLNHSACIPITAQLDRSDRVSVELDTSACLLRLRAIQTGDSTIWVHLVENSRVGHYIRVVVTQALLSPISILQGMIATIKSAKLHGKHPVTWVSGDPSILTIHAETGKMVAWAPGKTLLYVQTLQGVVSTAEVNVEPLRSLKLSSSKMLTNCPQADPIYVDLVTALSSADPESGEVFVTPHPFHCSLTWRDGDAYVDVPLEQLFDVIPVFRGNMPSCRISGKTIHRTLAGKLGFTDHHLTLTAQLNATRLTPAVYGSSPLTLHPAVVSSDSVVHVSNPHLSGKVDLIGPEEDLRGLQVSAHPSDFLQAELSTISYDANVVVLHVHMTQKALRYPQMWDSMVVTIRSVVSGQVITVNVSVDDGAAPFSQPLSDTSPWRNALTTAYDASYTILIYTLLLAVVVCGLLLRQGHVSLCRSTYGQVPAAVAGGSPLTAHQFSPLKTSPYAPLNTSRTSPAATPQIRVPRQLFSTTQ